jgi:hypothetical protein
MMALLWVEGFEGLQSGYDPGWWANHDLEKNLRRRYQRTSDVVNGRVRTTEGRFGGYGLEFFPGYNIWFETAPLTTDRTIITGCSLYWGQRNGASNRRIISLYDGDLLEGMQLRFDSSGEHFVIQRGAVELETITDVTIPIDEWFHVEFKVYCDNTNGSWELKFNGNTIGSASGVDTQASITNYHGSVRWNTSYAAPKIDDIFVCDGTGSKNNDFIGLMRVIPVWPDTDHTTEWDTVFGAASHAYAVDEQEPDDDTTYIEDDTVGNTDLFDYANIGEGLANIKGLMLNTLCRETDAESYDLIHVVRSGSVEYDQASQRVGASSYVHRYSIIESDPDTGSDWSEAGIDAAQFGIKVD